MCRRRSAAPPAGFPPAPRPNYNFWTAAARSRGPGPAPRNFGWRSAGKRDRYASDATLARKIGQRCASHRVQTCNNSEKRRKSRAQGTATCGTRHTQGIAHSGGTGSSSGSNITTTHEPSSMCTCFCFNDTNEQHWCFTVVVQNATWMARPLPEHCTAHLKVSPSALCTVIAKARSRSKATFKPRGVHSERTWTTSIQWPKLMITEWL